jgi:hypothetical protein
MHGVAEDAAEDLRADRQALGVERRLARQHAEALAEQVQGQARAGLVAHRDVAQHRILVHRGVVDQAQVAERGLGHAGDAQLVPRTRITDPRQRRFQADQVTRDQVRSIQPQRAQRFHVLRLQPRIARMVGEPEQLLFELVEHLRQMPGHLVRDEAEEVFEDPPYPPREVRGGEGGGGLGSRQVERNGHLSLGLRFPLLITPRRPRATPGGRSRGTSLSRRGTNR